MAHITSPAFVLLPANIAQSYCHAYMSDGFVNAFIQKERYSDSTWEYSPPPPPGWRYRMATSYCAALLYMPGSAKGYESVET